MLTIAGTTQYKDTNITGVFLQSLHTLPKKNQYLLSLTGYHALSTTRGRSWGDV